MPESPGEGWAAELAAACRSTGAPIDVSAFPALWGHHLRNTDQPLLILGNADYGSAGSPADAANAVHASLIESLSGLGRPSVTFFVLPVSRPISDELLDGVLMGLDDAKADDHIAYLGIAPINEAASISAWSRRDAFEIAFVPSDASPEYIALCRSRGATLVHQCDGPEAIPNRPRAEAKLVTVRTPEEVERCLNRAT